MGIYVAAVAQKKAINQAQTYIKSGKNLDKAEKLMEDLLKDSLHRENIKIWITNNMNKETKNYISSKNTIH